MVEQRLARLRHSMQEQQLEAIFITNAHNRRYLTGFTGSSGYVLVTSDQAVFFTDFRYMSQAAEQVQGWDIIEHGPKITEAVKQQLESLGISRLGFEQRDVTYGVYADYTKELEGIELVPTDRLVEALRMIKDEQELVIMQEAAELADRAYEHILQHLRPGVTEKQIALELEMFMRSNGATSTCFDTIVASGERSALPHGVASDRKLQSGEFVKMDFGAYYQGYCSDITRTVMLGKPTDKHREIYDIVLEAQMHALEHIKPGMTGKEADALTRDIIKRYGYGDYFGHSTGHSLGMEVHESPRLSFTESMVLQPGMTVTVEPGIYLPGFGGVRIEDDIVITERGAKRLTHAPKHWTVLE